MNVKIFKKLYDTQYIGVYQNSLRLKYDPRKAPNDLNTKLNPNLSLIRKLIPLGSIWMSSKKISIKNSY